MKKFFLMLTALAFFAAGFAGDVKAEPKPWVFSWWPGHWQNQDFQYYLENGKHAHPMRWRENSWTPDDWIAQTPGKMAMIQRLYDADILRDQDAEDGIPVLEVGRGFHLLGGRDKRRVLETVDHVYNITGRSKDGIFMIEDDKSNRKIGVYTREGVQFH